VHLSQWSVQHEEPHTPPTQKFCGECGARLGPDVPTGTFVPPKSYTQTYLKQQVATARGALEGERKQVTVLFCDIANSTALAERVGAEAMHTLLNRFFELALGELHRYECTINQFGGDGFMALCRSANAAMCTLRVRRAVPHDRPRGRHDRVLAATRTAGVGGAEARSA